MEPQARSVTEHVEHALALVTPLPAVETDLESALGSVLAEDQYAATSVPPFDGAAMDGYAVRLADLPHDGSPVTLEVTGDVTAGGSGLAAVGPGQAVRIMTGAPLPSGADAVVPVEHTSTGRFVAGVPRAESSVTLARRPRAHIRCRGEDVREGDLLAHAGTEVTAALVSALAASGAVRVPVRRRPLVVVLSTGSELVPAGQALGPGQITDSNGPMLAAAARASGADVVRLGPVPDDLAALRAALDEAVRSAGGTGRSGADLIVTAGGVSAGAADVVREALAAPGLGSAGGPGVSDVDVATVAMSPGKPQALARWRGVPWLALPGNPVGAYASFELFAHPAIDRLRGEQGSGRRRPTLTAAASWSGSPGRLRVVPVRLVPFPDDGAADSTTASAAGVVPAGSGHALSALAAADGLALVPPDVEKVRIGDPVQVLMLR
ncbi:molybdopterin molybdotransferase [Promicromonospora umidemergens]|uniref:Molybdopterin molybdenumtransferase n=1 Tax=Promicromonospora umidemergens TaxID=629679 RepID=A0ABP8X6K5_9MICO|nr:gephyrin-like molybdotransferase Glp [Promicromonospora umidemergens]MCP2285014.1 molybdopterin molybdotransferase [Promicromonospora umidemergens]